MTSNAQILTPPAAAGEGADPRRWLTLVILLLAAFMNLLDVSIVNIAIPAIRRDRLHDHVGAVRGRAEPGPAHRLPGCPGSHGRDHGPAGAGRHPGHLPAP